MASATPIGAPTDSTPTRDWAGVIKVVVLHVTLLLPTALADLDDDVYLLILFGCRSSCDSKVPMAGRSRSRGRLHRWAGLQIRQGGARLAGVEKAMR